MPRHSAAARLRDIVEAIDRSRTDTAGSTLEACEADWRKRWIVERGMEIISEPADMKARHPHIPWRKVAAIGNLLRHEYERTAPEVLWRAALDDLPALDKVCRDELAARILGCQADIMTRHTSKKPTTDAEPSRLKSDD